MSHSLRFRFFSAWVSASDAGLEIRAVTEGQTVADGDLQRTTFVVDASGTFSDISEWLASAAEALPGLVMRGFAITSAEEDQQALSFQATLSIFAPHPLSPVDASTTSDPRAQMFASPDR